MNTVINISDTLNSRIEAALDSIRPYLEADGGNVKMLEVTDDFNVKLEFVGNCVNCRMSTMTFKAGIEEAILRTVPEIKKVTVINLPAA